MIEKETIKNLTTRIASLVEEEHFNAVQADYLNQKYLKRVKIDIRRLSRQYHKPIKYIKRDLEKAERKLYNLLKDK